LLGPCHLDLKRVIQLIQVEALCDLHGRQLRDVALVVTYLVQINVHRLENLLLCWGGRRPFRPVIYAAFYLVSAELFGIGLIPLL
jgi:hypothetical protein